MSTSIWPYDTYLEPVPPIDVKSVGIITCFVISPFEPRARWDDMFSLIQSSAEQVGKSIGLQIKCFRADSIASSGVIHPEIWKALRTADIIVCDVSGRNGNVMMELGIASAWRRKEHVIILRDRNDGTDHLFDINPVRHLEYDLSFSGFQKLVRELREAISSALVGIPFMQPVRKSVRLPFQASLTNGQDAPELYTEDITHRRMLPDCVEFGAPLNYLYSWMSLGDLSLTRVRVAVEMKLTLSVDGLQPFMGVMVRGQHCFANFGHMVFVRDGKAYLTVRENDLGSYHDELLGAVGGPKSDGFYMFTVQIDGAAISAEVNDASFEKALAELPYVFSSGRILFIAGHCRVGIRNVSADSLE